MERCKTCKHWDAPFGDKQWGNCLLTRVEGDAYHDVETLAFADAAHAESAVLATAPDYGCVQHEPRDEHA